MEENRQGSTQNLSVYRPIHPARKVPTHDGTPYQYNRFIMTNSKFSTNQQPIFIIIYFFSSSGEIIAAETEREYLLDRIRAWEQATKLASPVRSNRSEITLVRHAFEITSKKFWLKNLKLNCRKRLSIRNQ